MPSVFFRSAKWVFIERFFQVLIAVLLNSVIARYLGVQPFGELQVALSLVAVFSAVGLFCSAEVVSPLYCSDKIGYARLLEEVLVIRFLMSVMSFFVFVLYVVFFTEASAPLLLILGLAILIAEPFNVFSIFFQAENKQHVISKIRICASFLKLFIVLLVILKQLTILYFGVAYFVEFLFVAIFLSLAYYQEKGALVKAPVLQNVKKILKNSVIVGLGLFFMVLFQKSDRLALDFLGLKQELGFYTAAMQIAENWFQLGMMIVAAVAAKMVYLSDSRQANMNILKIFMFVFILTVLAVALAYLLSDFVIKVLYGNAFSPSSRYLKLLVSMSFVIFLDVVLSLKLLRDKRTLLFFLKWLVAFVAAGVYFLFSFYGVIKFDPVVYVTLGYSVAGTFSIIYFICSFRHEKNTNNL